MYPAKLNNILKQACYKIIFIIIYLLRPFFKNIKIISIHPIIKNKPPKGVKNHMLFAVIEVKLMLYIEPENKKIPTKKIVLILFFCIVEKPLYVLTNNRMIT